MNRYYSNEVDSNETLPLPNDMPDIIGSESEAGKILLLGGMFCTNHTLPHSIMLYNICKRLMKQIYCRGVII